jgi:L-seryl-tRNA(Ser) seleniumtransferase
MSYRQLPAVDQLLNSPDGQAMIQNFGRDTSLNALRRALDQARHRISQGESAPDSAALIDSAQSQLHTLFNASLKPVINATGVILHTNLGRAPLSLRAQQAIQQIAASFSTLEYDLAAGERGKRQQHVEQQLIELTGAEASLVVNNNAAAVLLALTALASGRDTLISRTQLIEIGGGFRIPEVLAQSGTNLVEVGTTNRTHLRDFKRALSDQTALILRAHHSNFRLVGFTTEPELTELIQVANQAGIAMVDDLGSGAVIDTAAFGLAHEPMVQESLQAGAALVTFSGDKLLGGPQAGLIVGQAALVEQLRQHPLARAVRPDKLCLAALTATLESFLRGQHTTELPIWRMMAAALDELEERAQAWVETTGLGAVVASESTVGGGSLPGETLPTRVWQIPSRQPNHMAGLLRQAEPPVIGRVSEGMLLLDPRTVLPEQDEALVAAVEANKELE